MPTKIFFFSLHLKKKKILAHVNATKVYFHVLFSFLLSVNTDDVPLHQSTSVTVYDSRGFINADHDNHVKIILYDQVVQCLGALMTANTEKEMIKPSSVQFNVVLHQQNPNTVFEARS